MLLTFIILFLLIRKTQHDALLIYIIVLNIWLS